MKTLDLEALPPPVLPPSAFFSSKLSQRKRKFEKRRIAESLII
jgi:hypothetical protein